MERRSWRGRDGTHIPGFGTADRTYRLELDSESGSSRDLDGDGRIGDLIGITERSFTTTRGTTHKAGPFTTETSTTGAGTADPVHPAEQGTGGHQGMSAYTAMCTTGRGDRRSLLRGTLTHREATPIPEPPFLNPTHRAE
jgi:hypothetical protein